MLKIVENSLVRLLEVCNYTIAELLTRKGSQLDEEKLSIINSLEFKPQPFIAEIRSIIPLREELVYDCTVPEVSCFDANGFVAHNWEILS